MNADLRGLVAKWRDRAIAVGWLTHGGLARQECADELEAEASSLRGLLAGLREAITDWGDNMRSETMDDLLAHVDRIEAALSVAQGHGFVMVPRVPTYEMLCAGDVAAGRGNGRLTLPIYTAMLAAAPAQPDGVE